MFTREKIIEILSDDTQNEWLFSLADKIRKENVGDSVHLRGLVEFSNICKCDCKYCGLRKGNEHADRYRILKDEIIEIVKHASDMGYKTIVLQSGEDGYYSTDKMVEIIKGIKEFDVALTLSIGERSYEDYKVFKDAGADRYLIRIETTDRNLYKQMHPDMDFDNRLR